MAILTNSGRAAVATAIKAQPIHLAWGSGDPAWDDAPAPESIETSGLLAEVGRRRVTQTLYCLPDPEGDLIVPTGRFMASDVPTKYIYMRFAFDFEDAQSATIRELAVIVGSVIHADVPPGQAYVTPADVVDKGQLLALEHLTPKLERGPAVRQQFEFVIQF